MSPPFDLCRFCFLLYIKLKGIDPDWRDRCLFLETSSDLVNIILYKCSLIAESDAILCPTPANNFGSHFAFPSQKEHIRMNKVYNSPTIGHNDCKGGAPSVK